MDRYISIISHSHANLYVFMCGDPPDIKRQWQCAFRIHSSKDCHWMFSIFKGAVPSNLLPSSGGSFSLCYRVTFYRRVCVNGRKIFLYQVPDQRHTCARQHTCLGSNTINMSHVSATVGHDSGVQQTRTETIAFFRLPLCQRKISTNIYSKGRLP